MRKLLLAALCCVFVVLLVAQTHGRYDANLHQYVQTLNGTPSYLGTINSLDAGAFTNWSTTRVVLDGGTAHESNYFDAGYGSALMVQCSAHAFVSPSSTAATSTSVQIEPIEKFYLTLKSNVRTLSVLPADGGAQSDFCHVYLME